MTEIEKEALRLRDLWVKASNRLIDDDSEANIRAEQECWDTLVDFVEANGLNYTKFDPRGLD
jgi:hypothetical protein